MSRFGKFGWDGGSEKTESWQEIQAQMAKKRMDRLSSQELEMVRDYASVRAANKRPLKYNSMETFTQSHPGKFPRLSTPQMTLKPKTKHMMFNTSAVLAFDGLAYIIPFHDYDRKQIVILPVAEEELSSLRWARMKDDKWIPRPISCEDFLEEVYYNIGLDRSKTYKCMAEVQQTPRGLALMFDMATAWEAPSQKEEVTDVITGEIKMKRVKHYPERFKNGGGLSFDEYEAGRKNRAFNSLEGFVGGGMMPTDSDSPTALPKEIEEKLERKNTEELSDSVRKALERFGPTIDQVTEDGMFDDSEQLQMEMNPVADSVAEESEASRIQEGQNNERVEDEYRDEQVRNE